GHSRRSRPTRFGPAAASGAAPAARIRIDESAADLLAAPDTLNATSRSSPRGFALSNLAAVENGWRRSKRLAAIELPSRALVIALPSHALGPPPSRNPRAGAAAPLDRARAST